MTKELEKTIFDNLYRVADYVTQQGLYPVFVSLHGSQNYGVDVYMDEYQSDFDFKCVVLPRLWELVEDSKPMSTVVDFEGGHVDIKDIRVFMDTILKMNPSYLETLCTPFSITLHQEGRWIDAMKQHIPSLLAERGMLFTKACYGMFLEKKKAMCHPYPTLIHKIEKWGYDGKQVHHMYRLLLMLKSFEKTGKMILHPPEEEIQFLIDLKLNRYSLEEAQEMVGRWESELNEVRTRLENTYHEVGSKTAKGMTLFFKMCCVLVLPFSRRGGKTK